MARETGVSYMTLRRWKAAGSARAMFRPVTLLAQPESAVRPVVTLPCGVRVEGLDIGGVAELARRLR